MIFRAWVFAMKREITWIFCMGATTSLHPWFWDVREIICALFYKSIPDFEISFEYFWEFRKKKLCFFFFLCSKLWNKLRIWKGIQWKLSWVFSWFKTQLFNSINPFNTWKLFNLVNPFIPWKILHWEEKARNWKKTSYLLFCMELAIIRVWTLIPGPEMLLCRFDESPTVT